MGFKGQGSLYRKRRRRNTTQATCNQRSCIRKAPALDPNMAPTLISPNHLEMTFVSPGDLEDAEQAQRSQHAEAKGGVGPEYGPNHFKYAAYYDLEGDEVIC